MKYNYFKKYAGIFVLGVLLIAVYKTFDNFSVVINFLKLLISTLNPFIVGFSIAFIIYRPCLRIESFYQKSKIKFVKKHRRGLSVASVYLFLLVCLVLIFYLLIPPLTNSIIDFVNQIPFLTKEVVKYINSLEIIELDVDKWLDNLSPKSMLDYIGALKIDKYAKGVVSFSSAFISAFVAIIISIYMLLERALLKREFLKLSKVLVKEKTRNKITKYTNLTVNFIYQYFYCQLIDGLIVFAISFIILAVLKVKYYHVLALIIGTFNLIPYFGAIIACVIAIVITIFTGGLTKGIWVAILLILLQQVDANIIQPRIVKNSFSISPIWVIFGVVVGGGLFGILGILLAIPFMALFNSIMDDYIIWVGNENRKGDKNSV